MKDLFLSLDPVGFFFLSICINIAISIIGFIPSAFLTGANVLYYGFQNGLIVSIIGEAIGAVVSFVLYRYGVQKWSENKFLSHRYLIKLRNTSGMEGFFLVIGLRIFPFIPSAVVTLAASISKIGFLSFLIASTIGKIPALYIEALSIHSFFSFSTEWKWGTILISTVIFAVLYFKKRTGGSP